MGELATFPSSQRRGGRDINKTVAFRKVADGVVSSEPILRRAELTTPSAPLRRLRVFFFMAQPPLLCEEGNILLQPEGHGYCRDDLNRFAPQKQRPISPL